MPCDSITTQTISLAKAQPEVLRKALESIGWRIATATTGRIEATSPDWIIRVTWTAGQGMTFRGSTQDQQTKAAAAITQAYSRAAITWAAQRAGWTVKQGTEPNKMRLEKR